MRWCGSPSLIRTNFQYRSIANVSVDVSWKMSPMVIIVPLALHISSDDDDDASVMDVITINARENNRWKLVVSIANKSFVVEVVKSLLRWDDKVDTEGD